MDDSQLLRYSRQILLPAIGIGGQQRLLGARVLVIGARRPGLAGGACTWRRAASAGSTLVDHDEVELTNLQRQIVRTTATLGHAQGWNRPGRCCAGAQPGGHRCETIDRKLDALGCAGTSTVPTSCVDCSDNFATRFAVNRACVRRPQAAGVGRGDPVRGPGQSCYAPTLPDNPCYACLYRDTGMREEGDLCSQIGRAWHRLAGMIGTIQAAEALKLLLGIGDTADRPAAGARRPAHGIPHPYPAQGPGLPGVRHRGRSRLISANTPARSNAHCLSQPSAGSCLKSLRTNCATRPSISARNNRALSFTGVLPPFATSPSRRIWRNWVSTRS
ncbi:MAG: ThiF family adenylyltransferase [Chromatiales bacterium]|nr:ThiF family adenylyltransferase [Chromatiales bacterium]